MARRGVLKESGGSFGTMTLEVQEGQVHLRSLLRCKTVSNARAQAVGFLCCKPRRKGVGGRLTGPRVMAHH